MLRAGRARTLWAVAAVALIIYGVAFTATRVNFSTFTNELTFRGDSHASLRDAAQRPEGARGLRCGPVSTPNHKLIPDSRWLLDAPAGKVIARSDATERSRIGRGVAIYAVNRLSLLRSGFTVGDTSTEDTFNSIPMAGFDAGGRSRRTTAPMSVAEPAVLSPPAPKGSGQEVVAQRRWPWWVGLALVLGAALGLRVWGVKQGLPFAYNADENAHFVPNAIGLFGHGWDPHYFVNPPAYTYLLHVVFDVWFGGRAGRVEGPRHQPDRGLRRRAPDRRGRRHARGVAALPGGGQALRPRRRPAGRRAARRLLPGRLLLAPGAQRRADAGADRPLAVGHRRACCARDACATTCWPASGSAWRARRSTPAGSCCCRCVAAGAIQLAAPAGRTAAARGLVLAGIVALGAFVVANPYAVLDLAAFRDGLQHQADAADDALGKLGPDPELGAPVLPVDVHLGAGLGAARGRRRRPRPARRRRPPGAARARPGADPLRALHGHPGALLRALAAAGLPDRLPAGRLRDRPAHPARRAGACRRWGRRWRSWAPCCCWARGSSTRCTAR